MLDLHTSKPGTTRTETCTIRRGIAASGSIIVHLARVLRRTGSTLVYTCGRCGRPSTPRRIKCLWLRGYLTRRDDGRTLSRRSFGGIRSGRRRGTRSSSAVHEKTLHVKLRLVA